MRLVSRAVRGWLAALQSQAGAASRRALLSMLEPGQGARVIDCGCGDGALTVEVARRVGLGSVVGLEFWGPVAARARDRGLAVVRADLNAGLPLADAVVDAVVISRTISSIWNIDHFLREVHRVLAPGGYVAVLNANLASWHNVAYLVVGLQPLGAPASNEGQVGTWSPQAARVESPTSGKNFTLSGLKGLLAMHGLATERAEGIGYYPLPGPLAGIAAALDRRHASWMVVKARKR